MHIPCLHDSSHRQILRNEQPPAPGPESTRSPHLFPERIPHLTPAPYSHHTRLSTPPQSDPYSTWFPSGRVSHVLYEISRPPRRSACRFLRLWQGLGAVHTSANSADKAEEGNACSCEGEGGGIYACGEEAAVDSNRRIWMKCRLCCGGRDEFRRRVRICFQLLLRVRGGAQVVLYDR